MKNKNFIFPAIILLVVLASFTSLQHKRQIVPVTEKAVSALQMSKESVKTPATGNAVKVKGFANNFTGGLGYSSQAACESAYTFFYSGSFGSTATIYWNPSLTTKVTWGTVIVNHDINQIWTFNAATSKPVSNIGTCQ